MAEGNDQARDQERRVRLVVERYPVVISRAYAELLRYSLGPGSVQLRQGTTVVEAVLKYLTAILVRTYLALGPRAPQIDDRIKGFRIPKDGDWIALLRDCAGHFRGSGRRETDGEPPPTAGPAGLCRRIAALLLDDLPGGRQHEAYLSSERLADRMARLKGTQDQAGGPTRKQLKPQHLSLLERLIALRNFDAHGGAKVSDEEAKELFRLQHAVLTQLLLDLDFLADYPLLYVDEVAFDRGVHRATVVRHMGTPGAPERLTLPEPVLNEELYLVEMKPVNDDEGPCIDWLLSLSPYLVVGTCRSCDRPRVFTFGSLKGKKLEYVSYECPHHFSPAGHLADLEDIFAFLSGEIRIDQILKGKTLGEYFAQTGERVVSPQERREAGERLEQARRYLREEDTVLALEACHEAIELDPDSAEAHFTRGLLLILADDDLQRALDDMRHAARLDPENSRYTLAAAEALWALGRDGSQRGYLEESLRFLRETIRSDPTNRDALALRARVEAATTVAWSPSGKPAHEGDEVVPAPEGEQEVADHGGDLADEDQQDHHQV